ncbi:hypothetical protein MHTCC0001_23900 [Flavobacteriaceae bacterium MHTCC 0001]
MVDLSLNTKKPRTIVFRGTKEFNIEAMELSISVSAKANKNAGKKVPKNPVKIIHFQSFNDIAVIRLNATINKKDAVKIIRMAPNCTGVNPSNPFFMRINELPHINDKIMR